MNIEFQVGGACLSSISAVIAVLDEFLVHTRCSRAGFPDGIRTVGVLIVVDVKALIFNAVDEVEMPSLILNAELMRIKGIYLLSVTRKVTYRIRPDVDDASMYGVEPEIDNIEKIRVEDLHELTYDETPAIWT
ncbi:hypothetical protein V6N13_101062 [Hibiscus sabdariffa]